MSLPANLSNSASAIARRCTCVIVLFAALFAVLRAHAAEPATAPTTQSDPQIEKILATLEQRGKSLKSFTADAARSVIDPNLGTKSVFRGKVVFQSLPNNDARLHATFDTREDAGKIYPDKLEYILADGKLTERNYHSKTETIRQVARPGEKINLFKLGEGSFPLPIGQSPQDVHANFAVRRIAPDPTTDPANTDHLQLTPRVGTSLAKKFKNIDIWIDRVNDMPIRIETMDINETENLVTELTNLKINPSVRDSDFQPAKADTHDWEKTEDAYRD